MAMLLSSSQTELCRAITCDDFSTQNKQAVSLRDRFIGAVLHMCRRGFAGRAGRYSGWQACREAHQAICGMQHQVASLKLVA